MSSDVVLAFIVAVSDVVLAFIVAAVLSVGVISIMEYGMPSTKFLKRILLWIVAIGCSSFVIASPMIAAFLVDNDYIAWGWKYHDRHGWVNEMFVLSWLLLTVAFLAAGISAWIHLFGK